MSSIFTQTAKAASTGGQFEVPPAGQQAAVLVAMIDLGTHDEEFTNPKTGKTTIKPMRKVYFCWELTKASMTGSSFNHVIGRKYTLSLSASAALRKLVENYYHKDIPDGAPFDFTKLLGKPFIVTVNHSEGNGPNGDRTYANFGGVAAPPDGYTVPPPKHKPFSREVTSRELLPAWLPYEYDHASRSRLSLTDIIAKSHEVRGIGTRTAPSVAAPAPAREPEPTADEAPF